MDYDGAVERVREMTASIRERLTLNREQGHSYEDLQRENKLLEMLLRETRHDVRNKLNVAQGYIEIIQESGVLEDDEEEYLRSAMNALERGDETLEYIGEALSGESEKINLESEIEKCTANYQDEADKEGISLYLDSPEEEYPAVFADARTPLIFDNLIENTIQHAYQEAAEAGFRLRTVDSDGVKVRYEDDGPGMPDDILQSLGEFGSKGEESSGLGWGMALVVDILERGATEWEAGNSEEGFYLEMVFPTSRPSTDE